MNECAEGERRVENRESKVRYILTRGGGARVDGKEEWRAGHEGRRRGDEMGIDMDGCLHGMDEETQGYQPKGGRSYLERWTAANQSEEKEYV
jgi:hypothetical protein